MTRGGAGPIRTTGVLFVHGATLPPLGADTWVHAQIMRELDRSRYDVHVACAGTEAAPTPTSEVVRRIPDLKILPIDLGPELYAFPGRGRIWGLLASTRALLSLLRLAWYVRSRGIALIHTSDRPRDAAISVLLGRLTGVPSVVHAHVGYDPAWMSRPLRWGLRHADARIAVSSYVADTLIASGHDDSTTFVVHNGIDPAGWHPDDERVAARREFGIADDAPVVITVCRLFPSKGAGELLRALGRLADHPDVRLLVVGQDLSVDGAYTLELRRLACEIGMGERVVFTGRRSDVRRLMAAADVFAMPSIGEPFGLVYLEAMAMGLPVVALDSGGTPEVVVRGETGLLSAPGDLDGLADNLRWLLAEPQRRIEMGERGRRRVNELFTSALMARGTEAVYGRIARRRNGVPAPVAGAMTQEVDHVGSVDG